MKKIGVALLGIGTVGGGTYRILQENRQSIKDNYNIDIEVLRVVDLRSEQMLALGGDPSIVTTNIDDVINDERISIVAEAFGGIEPARSYLIKCLQAGKSIVTANKEMFSKHAEELEQAAIQGGAGLYFEATTAGGVPVIRTLTESMQGNRILSIMGIVNGTTNYILSKMADEGLEYQDVLKEAQALGYAEADPTADVDGYDAMYKLSILSTLAFHTRVEIDSIYREGISGIQREDIENGKDFGYTLKLLAIGKKTADSIEARVHPAFVKDTHPIAGVKGSFNAVHILGNNVGDIMLYGRGAGDLPTGSAIVSDIVVCAQATSHKHHFSYKKGESANITTDFETEYYVRMQVVDRPGVLAQISKVFAEHNISISSMHQKALCGKASLIFFIHKNKESSMKAAIAEISALQVVEKVEALIRVEG